MSIQSPRIGCGDDITMSNNTTTAMEKKKRPCKRKDCGDTTTVMEIKRKRAYRRKKYLPHDLIVQQILTRLPVPMLLKSVLVSKLWYNSIHNDHKRLTDSHFLQSQKQPQVIFSLLNVRVGDRVVSKRGRPMYGCHFFKFTTGVYSDDNVLAFDRFRGRLHYTDICQLVGYCNGLPCMAQMGYYTTDYMIMDPNRKDLLYIFYPAGVGMHTPNTQIICHGFGFDPTVEEYKLVSIFRSPQKEINFLVFTLGTKSWRDITTTSTPISGHRGRPILKIRAPTDSDKSAIFCTTSSSSSGCLAWKIIATLGRAGSNDVQHDNGNAVNNNEMEMLLAFNLHDEKFQFIQLPAKSTTNEQQKHLLVDYPHLLEFKGSPCIARIEKISGNGSDYPHRCHVDHQGGSSCCCCCKVHLYLLKDQVKPVWVKEESFHVRIQSTPTWRINVGHLTPEPCCFCFGSTTTPPTRIYSFSDQMFLYWFNRKYLQVYNLRSEKFQLVVPKYEEDAIFQAKMNEPRHKNISGNDDNYFPDMDYQLHCHEENFISLQTFIPKGVVGVEAGDFSELGLKTEDGSCSGYVLINRRSRVFYPF